MTVIAVAGPPGSGKTALCAALMRRLPGCALIAHDDYETWTQQPPEAIAAWLDEGGDPDAIDMDDMVDALACLVAGEPVRVPGSGEVVRAERYVIFDTPFARSHTRSAGFIDFQIWLDVAPDVALARKVRQFTAACIHDPEPADAARFVAWLDQYLANYMTIVRRACAAQCHRVKPGADLCLDADKEVADLAEQVLAEMRRRRLCPPASETGPAPPCDGAGQH